VWYIFVIELKSTTCDFFCCGGGLPIYDIRRLRIKTAYFLQMQNFRTGVFLFLYKCKNEDCLVVAGGLAVCCGFSFFLVYKKYKCTGLLARQNCFSSFGEIQEKEENVKLTRKSSS